MKRQFVKRGGLLLALALGAATVATGCIGGNCNDDTECESGFECVNYACQEKDLSCGADGVVCTESSQCSTNRCDNGCCALECVSNLDCGTGKECTDKNVCVPLGEEGCKADSDCPGIGLGICETTTGICVGCLNHGDCARDGLEVCNGDNQCVLAPGNCRIARDCATDEVCNNRNQCERLPGCSIDAHCTEDPLKRLCKPDRTCVECLVSSDCTGDFTCEDNACKPNFCETSAECRSETPETPVCDVGSVGATQKCVECLGHGDCKYGETCNDKQCVPNIFIEIMKCEDDSGCIDGETSEFYELRCVKEPGETEGRCKAKCDYYGEYRSYGTVESNCPADMACARTGWDGAKPVGTCMPAPEGGAELSEACSDDVACRLGLECVPNSATTGVCRKPCDPAKVGTGSGPGCPGGGASCRSMVDYDDQNRPRSYGLCYQTSVYLDNCATTEDCDAWQVCSKGLNRNAPAEVANTCNLPVGATKDLGGCAVDADCETGLCVDYNVKGASGGPGHCQVACGSDAQCDPNVAGACTKVPVQARNAAGQEVTTSVNSCVPQCASNVDCSTTPNTSCGVHENAHGSEWTTRCVSTVGTLKGGADCQEDSQCRTGTCLRVGDNPNGICLGVCSNIQDCDRLFKNGAKDIMACPAAGVLPFRGQAGTSANAPTGFPEITDAVAAPICWGATCIYDGDCVHSHPGDVRPRACVPMVNPLDPTGKPALHCAPAFGDRLAGAVCEEDSQCRTGQCIDWATITGDSAQPSRCYGACRSEVSYPADCNVAAPCKSTTLWPVGTQTPHRLCVPTGF